MDVAYINPFISTVCETFDSMMNTSARRGRLTVSAGPRPTRDVLVMMGVAGETRGAVALSFPGRTAIATVNRLFHRRAETVEDSVLDGVVELLGYIGKAAEEKVAALGYPPIALSLPIVVVGSKFSLDLSRGGQWLEIPFESDLGDFNLSVNFVANTESAPALAAH